MRRTSTRRKACARDEDLALAQRLQRAGGMECKLVTCPESDRLEMVAYHDSPLGALVEGCTRYNPADALSCSRRCAARRDLDVGDTTVYALRLPQR